MNKISYPSTIDLSSFKREIERPEAMYGLPNSIIYCSKCVISNQRPSSSIEFKNVIKEKKNIIQ